MTDSHPTDETTGRIEAEPTSDTVAGDEDVDGEGDAGESSATGRLSRRGTLAVLSALGLGTVLTGNASADSGDHLGELWDGSPGTGRGLETVLRENGQALKGTAGTNTDGQNDIGVKGTTYSTRGIGLEGLAAADTGNTIGLKGRADSPEGTALFGEARNTDPGESLAVEGLSRAEDGTAIQGYAEAAGDTIGVEGRVDSADGYGLSTPDDAKIDGALATVGDWQVTVDGDTAVTVGSESLTAGNVVHGHSANGVFDNAQASTVGGGGYFDGFTNNGNHVYDDFGTVAGGEGNLTGSTDGDSTTATHATVGGGRQNIASGEHSTIGGGDTNTASGTDATVGGGEENTASGVEATVGGGSVNRATGFQSTVAGGVSNDATGSEAMVGGGRNNTASDSDATVSGGYRNDATDSSTTVGGGLDNTASGSEATVAGGSFNTASGEKATVGGGGINTASGIRATVPGGLSGVAADDYSFVWNDGTDYHDTDGDGILDGLSSAQNVAGSGVTGDRTFHASAVGGFRFITGSNSVTYISDGSTGWSTTSTRAAKTNVDPVDSQDVLAGVEEMDVATWEYRDGDGEGAGVRHMGPMAEAFHSAFDLGASDTGINSINADGVAFAAIQGMAERLAELREELVEKTARIEELEDEVNGLEAETEELEAVSERLHAVEDRLADIEAGESSVSTDDD